MIAALFAVSPEWSANFLFIFARLSAAIVAIPVIGARTVPGPAKIGLAVVLSLIVLPLQQDARLSAAATEAATNLLLFASRLGSEVLVGLVLGVAVSLVFAGLEMAATIVGVQIGFGMQGVFDPITGTQSSVLDQFYRLLVALTFFAINGHHLVIQGLLHSFDIIPPGGADISLIAGERVAPFFTALLNVAVRIALPVMGALMLTDLAMGLAARTTPQMNVLVVGFPAKIGVGLLVLTASVPFAAAFIATVFGQALPEMNSFLRP